MIKRKIIADQIHTQTKKQVLAILMTSINHQIITPLHLLNGIIGLLIRENGNFTDNDVLVQKIGAIKTHLSAIQAKGEKIRGVFYSLETLCGQPEKMLIDLAEILKTLEFENYLTPTKEYIKSVFQTYLKQDFEDLERETAEFITEINKTSYIDPRNYLEGITVNVARLAKLSDLPNQLTGSAIYFSDADGIVMENQLANLISAKHKIFKLTNKGLFNYPDVVN